MSACLLYDVLVAGSALVWLSDNQAAVSVVMKASSTMGVVVKTAHLTSVLRQRMQERAYFGWMDSLSNTRQLVTRWPQRPLGPGERLVIPCMISLARRTPTDRAVVICLCTSSETVGAFREKPWVTRKGP